MKSMAVAPSLAEQVRDAVLDEIATGRWPAGSRVIQEQLAQQLGVSRQPVQQALREQQV
jgi:DNA-binding GntR family transcriptional regulator